MMDIYGWLSQKAAEIKSTCHEFFSYTMNTSRATYQFILNLIHQWPDKQHDLLQFWQGFSRLFDPSTISALIQSKKTRQVLLQSGYANLVLYMGSAFFYETSKHYAKKYAPELEHSNTEFVIDTLAAWYFTRIAIRSLIDNNIYNICIAKVVADENPNHIIKPCPCSVVKKVKANIASPFYYGSNLLAIHMVESTVPLGKALSLPLRAQCFGQVFLEYQLTELCTKHRYEFMNKNSIFTFALGLSYILSVELSNKILASVMGHDNRYVRDALYSFMFQYFIMLALLYDKPFANRQNGKDVFFLNRSMMETLLSQGAKEVINMIKHPKLDIDWKNEINKLQHDKMLSFLRTIFLQKEYRESRLFIKTSALSLFFDLKGEDIQKLLTSLIYIREQPISRLVKYLPNFLLPSPVKHAFQFLLNKKIDGLLEKMNQFIDAAMLKIKIYDEKRLQEVANDDLAHDHKNEMIEKQPKKLNGFLLIEDYYQHAVGLEKNSFFQKPSNQAVAKNESNLAFSSSL